MTRSFGINDLPAARILNRAAGVDEPGRPLVTAAPRCVGSSEGRQPAYPRMNANNTSSSSGDPLGLIPFPKAGEVCPISGLSRSTIFELTKEPNPKVATLRLTGSGKSGRGTRRILVSSLREYLFSEGTITGSVPEATKRALDLLGLPPSDAGDLNAKLGSALPMQPASQADSGSRLALCYARVAKLSFHEVVAELVADGYPDYVARTMAFSSFPELLWEQEAGEAELSA